MFRRGMSEGRNECSGRDRREKGLPPMTAPPIKPSEWWACVDERGVVYAVYKTPAACPFTSWRSGIQIAAPSVASSCRKRRR